VPLVSKESVLELVEKRKVRGTGWAELGSPGEGPLKRRWCGGVGPVWVPGL